MSFFLAPLKAEATLSTVKSFPGEATRSRTAAICSAIFFGQGLITAGAGADWGPSSSSPVGSGACVSGFLPEGFWKSGRSQRTRPFSSSLARSALRATSFSRICEGSGS